MAAVEAARRSRQIRASRRADLVLDELGHMVVALVTGILLERRDPNRSQGAAVKAVAKAVARAVLREGQTLDFLEGIPGCRITK